MTVEGPALCKMHRREAEQKAVQSARRLRKLVCTNGSSGEEGCLGHIKWKTEEGMGGSRASKVRNKVGARGQSLYLQKSTKDGDHISLR